MTRISTRVLILLLSCTLYLQAQEPDHGILNANKILTTMSSNGMMFFSDDDEGYFIGPNVPGADAASTIFASNLWIGGLDPAGNLRSAFNLYDQDGGSFQAGPLDPILGVAFEDLDAELFNKVWSVNRTEILAHLEDFADGNIDGVVSDNILEWPARGNVLYAGVLDNINAAAFHDENGDGIYDPLQGDHPILDPGVIPDQMLFAMYNDVGFANQGRPTQIEIQLTMYAFSCAENEALNHSVFTRHKITNRASEDLRDARVALFQDFDLGCYTDDYIGCDPENNLVYVYNQDAEDGDAGGNCQGGVMPFTTEVPVQSTRFLNFDLSSFIAFQNAGVGNPHPATTDPQIHDEMFNYLNGVWRDGTPITTGGNGYNPGSTDETSFLFPGNPNSPTEWSMSAEDLTEGDWRGVASMDLGTYLPGAVMQIDAVHTLNRAAGLNHLENVNFAIEQSIAIQDMYNQNFQNVCTQNALCDADNCVYPGDVNDNEIVERTDWMLHGIAVAKTAADNQSPRAFISNKWDEFPADDRTGSFASGVNRVHADCNGDGVINGLDRTAIRANFGLETRNYLSHTEETTPFANAATIEIDFPDMIDLDAPVSVVFGGVDIVNMENFHSVSYILEYNPNVFEPFGNDPQVSGIAGGFLTGFGTILEPGKILVIKGNNTEFDTSVSDIDDSFIMEILDGVTTNQTRIKVTDILIADYAENFYSLPDLERVIAIEGETVSTQDLVADEIRIYPNPSNGILQIDTELNIDSYQLYGLNGQRVQAGKLNSKTLQLDAQPGMYVLKLFGPNGLEGYKKIIID